MQFDNIYTSHTFVFPPHLMEMDLPSHENVLIFGYWVYPCVGWYFQYGLYPWFVVFLSSTISMFSDVLVGWKWYDNLKPGSHGESVLEFRTCFQNLLFFIYVLSEYWVFGHMIKESFWLMIFIFKTNAFLRKMLFLYSIHYVRKLSFK